MENGLFESAGNSMRPLCYSAQQAAEAMGLSLSTLRRMTKAGELTPVQLSERRVGYRLEELERFLRGRESRRF